MFTNYLAGCVSTHHNIPQIAGASRRTLRQVCERDIEQQAGSLSEFVFSVLQEGHKGNNGDSEGRLLHRNYENGLVAKDGDTGCVTVNVILTADRAELSLSKEAGQRHLVQSFLNRPGVVVRAGEQPSAASVAAEQERRSGCDFRILDGPRQERVQFFVSGLSIPNVKPDGLADSDPIANRDRAGFFVDANDV
mgnify:CR=1 FL=1